MKQITVDQDVFDFLVSKATSPGEPPGAVIRRELRVPPAQKALEVDDETYAFIAAKTTVVGESVSDILRRELHLGGGTAPGGPPAHGQPAPATVVFRIPSGTGQRAWNDGSSRVIAKVGDTLRIVNDDSVGHRLHTAGRPFPHPETDIFPGGSADFVLQTTFDPSADGPLTDHAQGSQALFFIEVTAAG
jgi:hypothetical protein